MIERNNLYCGDCLDFMREMPDKSIDLILTDPPYGIGEGSSKNKHRIPITKFGKAPGLTGGRIPPPTDYGEIEWDSKPPGEEYFTEIMRVSKNQIIFGGNYFPLPPSPCWIVWDKDNGASDFADCELAWTSFKSAVRKFKWRWSGLLQEDMVHKEKRVHPTQKPLPLMEWCLEKYSKPGDIVLDPFMGSGTTMVACKKLGREYIGIDNVMEYFNIARDRLETVNNTKLDEWFE
jgi:site-specific DNA-methyltransferase (adenine-specific)